MSQGTQQAATSATFDSVSMSDERILNDSQRDAVDLLVKKYLTDKCGVKDAQFESVRNLILCNLAIRTTSSKVTSHGADWMKVNFGTDVIRVNDAELINVLNGAAALSGKKNPLRVYARSHEATYLDFYKKNKSKLGAMTKANKAGFKSEHDYLQADFLTRGVNLSVEEQAALAQGRFRMLDYGKSETKDDRVNLYQLGNRV